jgi:hypothetical protein
LTFSLRSDLVAWDAMAESSKSEAPTSTLGRVASRVFRFVGGFAAGVAILVAIEIGRVSLATETDRDASGLTVTTSGAAASARGGRIVLVRTARVLARLNCRDGCDDLRLDENGGAVMTIEVRDAQGRCLACADPNGKRPRRARDVWRVGDPSGLRLVRTTAAEPRTPH